jgi:hypothetical protein
MKKLIFASLILISQAAIAVNCPPTLGFSFPLKPRTNYSTISNEPEKACLDGKNITNWLTEGDILTSFLKAQSSIMLQPEMQKVIILKCLLFTN